MFSLTQQITNLQPPTGTVEAPEYFPPIRDCHAVEKPIYRQELEVPLSQLKRGMLPNASRDLVFPGFPTMRHLKYEVRALVNRNKNNKDFVTCKKICNYRYEMIYTVFSFSKV